MHIATCHCERSVAIKGRVWVATAVLLLALVSTATAKYSGGSGTAQDAYQIATAADLIALGETPADYDKHFILTADIDLDPNLPGRKVFDKAVIAPVTYVTGVGLRGTPFSGVFDGNGRTISHLTIRGGGDLGLFGHLASGAEVKDLGLVAVEVTGSGDVVGGLVGSNGWWPAGGTVTRCYSTGAVSGRWNVGGLVGFNYMSTVIECYSTGAVSGADQHAGGLVGCNYWGAVTRSYSTATVRGKDSVGGLVGENYEGPVTDCFWDIQTSRQAKSAGGIGKTTAEMQTAATFFEWSICEGEGVWTIDEGNDYPRLSWEKKPGHLLAAKLSDFLTGEGTEASPYLIYTLEQLHLVGPFACERDKHFALMADIDLTGTTYSKAVIPIFDGTFDGNGHTISRLTIKGESDLGLFGHLESRAEVKNLGVVDVNISGSSVGALVGYNGGTVICCYSTGAVRGTGQSVGGLVGYNRGTVIQCYASGTVTGAGLTVGGLVGRNFAGTVSNSYSTAAVCGGPWYVGGLVGWNSNAGHVTHCYSAGAVSRNTSGGGMVGFNYYGTVTECFWDIQTSGQTNSGAGVGQATAQMQTAKTFLDAGWDFVGETANGTEDLWWILEGKDYPRLGREAHN